MGKVSFVNGAGQSHIGWMQIALLREARAIPIKLYDEPFGAHYGPALDRVAAASAPEAFKIVRTSRSHILLDFPGTASMHG
jgi:hypothetical protein